MIQENLLAQAKQRLPLSALMARLGCGDRTKKSARCPFHEDSSASFSLYVGDDGEERWKCFAGCGQGDAIDFLAKHGGLSNADACREFIQLAGVALPPAPPSSSNPSPSVQRPFDWQSCVAALTPEHRAKLAEWRSYTPDFIEWLHLQNLIGLFDGERITFPVHDAGRNVIGCHYRLKEDGRGATIPPAHAPRRSSSATLRPPKPFWFSSRNGICWPCWIVCTITFNRWPTPPPSPRAARAMRARLLAYAPRMPSSMRSDRMTRPARSGLPPSPPIPGARRFMSSRQRRIKTRTTGHARVQPDRKSKRPLPPRNLSPFQPPPTFTPRRRKMFQKLSSSCPKNLTSRKPRRFPWTPCRRQWLV